eukprot:TRINITY_DN48293_c0_g1_i1.p1 TRINITY_DN48293_c0_g1~~TRINITY_DN48293_c0_g1_i1.p1  ORF type:complete len:575 (+),score=82.16 TRINITY_DN48293_c0_g1_i1:33-1757(+)
MAPAVVEFQRNTAFSLFAVVVSSAAFVFLLERLRSLLIPLIWAFFFAIPILSFAERIELLVTWCLSAAADYVFGRARSGPVAFRHVPGRNCIQLDRHDDASAAAADSLLLAVHSRCSRRFGAESRTSYLVSAALRRLDRSCLSCLWGQRVRVLRLQRSIGIDQREEEVGGLVEGRSYYASVDDVGALLASEGGDAHGADLRLFIDRQQTCPAVLQPLAHYGRDRVGNDGGGAAAGERLQGVLEVDQRSTFSWIVSMLLTLCTIVVLAWGLIKMLSIGIDGVIQNLENYKIGVAELVEDIKNATSSLVPPQDWDRIRKQLTDELSEYGKRIAEGSLSFVESIGGTLFLFVLYLLFWICEPLPVNEPIAKVFKDYMALKTIVCLLFAGIMAALLAGLSCPLWPLYFFITFLLNYIPEIGPMLAGLLMLPAVLLDGSVPRGARYAHASVLTVGGICAKLLTGNLIEVDLYNRFGGEFMRIHPVVLFVFFTFCGYQLGTTGMFISIPILAAVKYSLVSGALPAKYLHPVLVLIEGDVWAPHRNAAERRRCASVEAARLATAARTPVQAQGGTELSSGV